MQLARLQNNLTLRIVLLLCIVPLSGMCTDIYSPSLPVIMHYFNTTSSLSQMTIPAFILGLGLGQFVLGVLSDSYGRRKILLAGLFLTVVMSLVAASATNILFLIGTRFVQGLAASSPAAVGRAILVDSYSGKDLSRKSGYSGVCYALGAIVSPMIGGYLQHFFGWQASFVALAIYAGILFIVSALFIPETLKHRHAFSAKTIFNNAGALISNPIFIYLILTMLFTYNFVLTFNVVGPFLVQHVLHKSVIFYGHIAMFLGFGWLVGSFANRFFIERFSHRSLVIVVSFVSLLMVAVFGVLTETRSMTILNLVLPCFLIYVAAAMVFTNAYSMMLRIFKKTAGTTSSLFGSLTLVANSILTGLVGAFHVKTQGPMAIYYGVMGVLLVLVGTCVFRATREHCSRASH